MKIKYIRDARLSEPYIFDNIELRHGDIIEVPAKWQEYRSFHIKVRIGMFEVQEEAPKVAPKPAEVKKVVEDKEDSPKPKRRTKAKVKKEQTSLDLGV